MSTATKTQSLTAGQTKNLALLRENFGLSDAELNRVLFFRADSDEPWIPPDITMAISRQTGQIKHLTPSFVEYVAELKQYVYSATAIDLRDFTFTRVGVAKEGERSNGVEIDPNTLAEGRALNAALTAAGVNPFKAGTVAKVDRLLRVSTPEFSGVPLTDEQKRVFNSTDAIVRRNNDLAHIHQLGVEKGLILMLPSGGKDMTRYRDWLNNHFQTRTAATLDGQQRAMVANALKNYERDFLLNVPVELHEDALIA